MNQIMVARVMLQVQTIVQTDLNWVEYFQMYF